MRRRNRPQRQQSRKNPDLPKALLPGNSDRPRQHHPPQIWVPRAGAGLGEMKIASDAGAGAGAVGPSGSPAPARAAGRRPSAPPRQGQKYRRSSDIQQKSPFYFILKKAETN